MPRLMAPPRAAFTIHRPDPALAVPLIIHVPHAGDAIPADCLADFALPRDDLQSVLAALVDHDTDRLALSALPLGAFVIVNEVSRLVVDPERYPDDADEPAAVHGMGAVYVHTHDGRRLRRPGWSAVDRAARMAAFYHPWHAAMRDLVLELQARFTAPVHIIDLHSFPVRPLPFETCCGPRPPYCLGWTDAHAPRAWLDWWDARASAVGGGLVAHNHPFAGAFVPGGLPAGAAAAMRSLMVEVRRDLLPAWPERGELPAAHARAHDVRDFLAFACEDLRRRNSPDANERTSR